MQIRKYLIRQKINKKVKNRSHINNYIFLFIQYKITLKI